MNDQTPPTNYKQWIEWFDYLKNCLRLDKGAVDLLCNGSLVSSDVIYKQFKIQLIETINIFMNKTVNEFIKELNKCFEFNDFSNMVFNYNKLRTNLDNILFFKKLNFLDNDYKQELDKSLKIEIKKFLKQIDKELNNNDSNETNFDLQHLRALIKNYMNSLNKE